MRPEGAKVLYTMPQSLCKIYLHIIFHTKTTSPKIDDDDTVRMFQYIAQLINSTGCITVIVGGMNDHIHVLCLLSREVTISHLVEEIKRNSSRWIKTIAQKYKHFEWQGGYAAFSVSKSVVDETFKYIQNQKEHHKKRTFEEEYIQFLKLYDVEYNEKYVFSD